MSTLYAVSAAMWLFFAWSVDFESKADQWLCRIALGLHAGWLVGFAVAG